MHEVLSRWEQHYLSLNPTVYYQQLSCPVGIFYSESEVAGLLSKRLSEFKKVFNKANQVHPIRQIKHVDHNLITTDHLPKAVSSAFINNTVSSFEIWLSSPTLPELAIQTVKPIYIN